MSILNQKVRYLALITGAVLLLASTNTVAAVMTFTDRVDPNPDQLISFGNNSSYSFTHSIVIDQDGASTYWSGIYGYNSLTDIISGVSMAIRIEPLSAIKIEPPFQG